MTIAKSSDPEAPQSCEVRLALVQIPWESKCDTRWASDRKYPRGKSFLKAASEGGCAAGQTPRSACGRRSVPESKHFQGRVRVPKHDSNGDPAAKGTQPCDQEPLRGRGNGIRYAAGDAPGDGRAGWRPIVPVEPARGAGQSCLLRRLRREPVSRVWEGEVVTSVGHWGGPTACASALSDVRLPVPSPRRPRGGASGRGVGRD